MTFNATCKIKTNLEIFLANIVKFEQIFLPTSGHTGREVVAS